MDSHSVMADRFDESASWVDKEILPQLVKLREKLEEEVKVHETLGKAFVEYLEAADDAVIETWGKEEQAMPIALSFLVISRVHLYYSYLYELPGYFTCSHILFLFI